MLKALATHRTANASGFLVSVSGGAPLPANEPIVLLVADLERLEHACRCPIN
jgi:hypothetical protein